jgi:hypothetical protein
MREDGVLLVHNSAKEKRTDLESDTKQPVAHLLVVLAQSDEAALAFDRE